MTFPYLGETLELNEETRKQAGGSFIALSDGIAHYELSGEPSAQTVVLVHGFSVPYFIYDPTFDFLVQNGFRVLRYDLFGRGYSDRPRVQYNIDLFVRQLKELLDALNLQPVHLVGLSMGGPIVAAFIERFPEDVRKYVLIDPAGAQSLALPWSVRMAKIPLLAELFFGWMGDGSLLKGLADDLFDKRLADMFVERYKTQMRFKGFKRALLSTMRGGMLDSFEETYRRVGKLGKPALLFWGEQDRTVPYEHSAALRNALPGVKFCPVSHCGHIPHYEKPEIVNPLLLEFLSRER